MRIYKVEIPYYYNWEVHWFDKKPDDKYIDGSWRENAEGSPNNVMSMVIPQGTLLEIQSVSGDYVNVETTDKQLRFSLTIEQLKFIRSK